MVICFLGDSLTLGVGDEQGLGWPGRITARLMADGQDITAYNLGVRKNTSVLLSHRWQAETALRNLDGVETRLVFSFGVADHFNQIPAEETLSAAFAILTKALESFPILVVGPTPVDDEEACEEITVTSDLIEAMCRQLAIPFVATIDAMSQSAVYRRALADGDTAHPTGAGYAELANHILNSNEARTFFGLE